MPYFDILAPTDFEPLDKDPSVSAEDKLRVIDTSRPLIEIGKFGDFSVRFPFTDGAVFDHPTLEYPTQLMTGHVNVGDPALYGNGIGSRMLKAAAVFGQERFPRIGTLKLRGYTSLGMVNTVISVFGAENTTIDFEGELYGEYGGKELDQLLVDRPPEEGKAYKVDGASCTLDAERMSSWSGDSPIVRYNLPKQRPEHHRNGMDVDVESIADGRGNSLLAFYYRHVGEFVVANIDVLPENRGKGIGTRLVDQSIELARSLGAKRLIGEADSPVALAFARGVLYDPIVRSIPLFGDSPDQVRALVEVGL